MRVLAPWRSRGQGEPEPAGAPGRLRLGGQGPHAEQLLTVAEAEADDDQDRVPAAGDQEHWTRGVSLRTRAVGAVMTLALLTGPVALGWVALDQFSSSTGTAVPVASQDGDRAARMAAANETATQWVLAWLSADRTTPEVVSAYWAGPIELPDRGQDVLAASPLLAEATAPGVWTVTVGADLLLGGGEDQTLVRRYFQVPVSVEGGQGDASARVMALPAPVTGPGRQAPNRNAVYSQRLVDGDPVSAAVSDFLDAYLTGSGDLARFTSPGTTWRPLEVPYGDVRVQAVQAIAVSGRDLTAATEGDQVRVLADVQLLEERPEQSGQQNSRAGIQSQYALTLTARAGRWEVTKIDDAPTSTSTTTEESTGS